MRGTGTTTKQMLAAPKGSVFVWHNDQLEYPKKLAAKCGRLDLNIVSISWLMSHQWRGCLLTGLVLDHFTEGRLTGEQWDAYIAAKSRIRNIT